MHSCECRETLSGISCDLKMKLNNIHGNFVGHFNDCCTSILRLSLGICGTFCKIRPKFTKFMYCINFLSVRLQREIALLNLCPRGHKLVSSCCIPERYGLYPCISSVFLQLKFAAIICILLWIYLSVTVRFHLNHY